MSELASPGQLRAGFLRWALFLVPAVLLLGFLSGVLAGSGPGNPWFDSLAKPAIYPPPAVFGIVWSILYVLIGIAVSLIAAARGARGRGIALAFFALQLILNLGWTPLFFGAHRIDGALILIAALDVAVIVTIVLFARVRPVAAWLLVPYLLWALFATALNYQFMRLNPASAVHEGRAVQRIEL